MKKQIISMIIFFVGACTLSPDKDATPNYPSSSRRPVPSSAPSLFGALSPTPNLNVPGYSQATLQCETYLETTWGKGLVQWSGSLVDAFPLLLFNQQGELYLPDYPNRRLLVYNGLEPSPVQVITLPDAYFEQGGFTWPGPQMPFLTAENIFIPYAFDKLAILSLEGREEKNVQLPYQFALLGGFWNYVLVDQRGGLFINGGSVLVNGKESITLSYFDKSWQNGKWNMLSSAPAVTMTPFIWKDFFVSQESKSIFLGEAEQGISSAKDWRIDFFIALRKIDLSTDFLGKAPDYIPTGLVGYGYWLKGIDQEGWAYIQTYHFPIAAFARYSIPSGKGQIGKFPDYLLGKVVQSGIAPDGTIYLVVNNRNGSDSQPKIVKCRFPGN